MDMAISGILSLLILVADIWALINILQSAATTGMKVLWALLVLIFPVLGFIIWFFAGPKSSRV